MEPREAPTAAEPDPLAGRNLLYERWRRLSALPGGKWLFSRFVGWIAPYTATIRPRVETLEPGFARVAMGDRRRVRNPFRSVHAVALMNLAEAASGLAALTALPPEARAIITGLSIEYEKKARGPLVAEAKTDLRWEGGREEKIIPAVIHNAAGEVVARAEACWLVGPR